MQPLAFTTAIADLRTGEEIATARTARVSGLFRRRSPRRQTRPVRRVGGAR
jgi:hypothetical protein